MAASKIELRIAKLEEKVAQLEQRFEPTPEASKHWIDDVYGAFAADPDFWEAMRLGREYRESLRPEPRKRVVKS